MTQHLSPSALQELMEWIDKEYPVLIIHDSRIPASILKAKILSLSTPCPAMEEGVRCVIKLPKEKDLSVIVGDEMQQDWRELKYKETYRHGVLRGFELYNAEIIKLNYDNTSQPPAMEEGEKRFSLEDIYSVALYCIARKETPIEILKPDLDKFIQSLTKQELPHPSSEGGLRDIQQDEIVKLRQHNRELIELLKRVEGVFPMHDGQMTITESEIHADITLAIQKHK